MSTNRSMKPLCHACARFRQNARLGCVSFVIATLFWSLGTDQLDAQTPATHPPSAATPEKQTQPNPGQQSNPQSNPQSDDADSLAADSDTKSTLRKMPLRLLTSQEVISKNLAVKEIAGFVNQATSILQRMSEEAKTNFDLRIVYTFRPEGTHQVRILRRGEVDKAWLKQLQASLTGLQSPNSKTDEIQIEANYQVVGDRQAFAAMQAQKKKAADEKLAEMVRDGVAAGDHERAQIVATEIDAEAALKEAREYSWPVVKMLMQKLRKTDSDQFPGIHAWLKDFDTATEGKTPTEASIDVDQLITKNANFWQANFEVAPGDIGWAMIHAGLLQSAGEIKRSNHRLVIARQFPANETIMRAVSGIDGHNMRVINAFSSRTKEGITLHDEKNYEAARAIYRTILDAWPQYAWCWYELSLTQHSMDVIAAGNEPLPLDAVLTDQEAVEKDKMKNPISPEVMTQRVRSRQHDPLFWQNLSGVPDGKKKVAVLLRVALPAFKKFIQPNPDEIDQRLLMNFAGTCQMIEAHELAMATLGVVVGRRKGYRPYDHSFIKKSLESLAPGATTDATLKRLAAEKEHSVIQIIGR